MVVGPSAAGKTRILLGLLLRGGRLVAAEHVVVAPDASLHGRSEAVRVRPHHLSNFEDGGLTMPAAAHHRLLFWRVASAVLQAVTAPLPQHLQQRIASRLRDHAFVDVDVDAFPSESGTRMRLLVLLGPTEQNGKQGLMTIDPADAVARLAVLYRDDIAALLPVQRLASYARPPLALPSEMVDGRAFTDVAHHALQGVTVMTATVPKDQDPDCLLDAIAEVVRNAS
ncbi:MAG: hypothetical protein M3137_10225 [Actinomycetota bacterium]|nr:hypothetical protein [Actinomycetota bacterium]